MRRANTGRFAEWAQHERAYQFFCQTLIDLRIEPRWLPDLASTEQFQNEILGCLASIAGLHDGSLRDGPLRSALSADDGKPSPNISIAAFWPGPLEGPESTEPKPLPGFLSELIVADLNTPGLEPKSFFALINARGFTLDSTHIDLAIQSLRNARYRVANDNPGAVTSIYFGLAAVASSGRRPDLADEVRILIRRGRHEHAEPVSPLNELSIAMTAAAAHREEKAWAEFIGDWALEIALRDIGKDYTRSVLVELRVLARFSPALAAGTGPARAALAALAQS